MQVFERLEGMFAVALWDRETNGLHLARYGVGIKPLVVARNKNRILFASEIKYLFASSYISDTVTPKAMHQFLAPGYVSPEDSLYAAIEQVPPGTVLTVGEEGQTRWRFWQPTRKSDIVRLEEAVEVFEPIWQKVVEDHLVSDVCIGVLQKRWCRFTPCEP